jgi:adenosylcobyric acid synthase
MQVAEYLCYKQVAWQSVIRAYDSLAAEAGIMVIEGAGSPAEINLKAHDIVNMAIARHARAKVLLVGDIDRGGVFAALLGTWELLEPEERAFVTGFVLNKFRGDSSLLAPALDEISARTGRLFLGVLPWLPALELPEEDSAGSVRYEGAGLENAGDSDFTPALNRLAASVREHLDMEHIYRALGLR